MMEEWRDIQGYEGIYQVSSYGRVRSLDGGHTIPKGARGTVVPRKGRILKPQVKHQGYLGVTLWKTGKPTNWTIHRLVALMFCEGYEEGLVVNHKDENITNNNADNLEWVTVQYNSAYSAFNEKRKHHPMCKKITAIKDGVKTDYYSIRECSRHIGGNYSVLLKAVASNKAYRGYSFEK